MNMNFEEAKSIVDWFETDPKTLLDYGRSHKISDVIEAFGILNKPVPMWIAEAQGEYKKSEEIMKICNELGKACSNALDNVFLEVFINKGLRK